MPTAVIFSSVAPMECSVSQRSNPVRRLPTLFTTLQHPRYARISTDEFEAGCKDVFTNLIVTKGKADYLEESTCLQSQSPLWYQHRAGCITASIVQKVKHASISNPPSSLIKTIIHQTTSDDGRKVPSLQWRSATRM